MIVCIIKSLTIILCSMQMKSTKIYHKLILHIYLKLSLMRNKRIFIET